MVKDLSQKLIEMVVELFYNLIVQATDEVLII
jgi:hypothetical protein